MSALDGMDGLRCIFCGRDRLRLEEANGYFWIACVDCAAEGPALLTARAAVSQWLEIENLTIRTAAARKALEQSVREFTDTHGRNGSKTGRADYLAMIPLDEIERLRAALVVYDAIKEPTPDVAGEIQRQRGVRAGEVG